MTGGRSSGDAPVAPFTRFSIARTIRWAPPSSRRLRFLARPVADILAGRLIDLFHAELDLAAIIEAEHLDLDLIAHLDDVGDLADALRRELADMDEAVLGAKEVHEGAEIDDLDDLAVVDHADLRLGDDASDPVDRRLGGGFIDRGDLDRAVILDIDLGAGGLADLADHLAARADHFTDLVLRDGQRGDARRVRADALARPGQRLRHLAENVQTPVLGLAERDLHDLLGDRGDLDIHLQGGDAARGAGDLEIHVAEMILVTENIGEHGEAVRLLDQPHGDAGDRRLERHAGIHQRERGATYRRHRRRAVRLGDLRDDADGVGEALLRRQQRPHGAPGELAVADLAGSWRTHPLRLARRIGREVVMQHEVRAELAVERVDDLLILTGAERRHHETLRLAAGEEGRAVRARQQADLADDLPHRLGVTPVDALAGLQDGAADEVLLEVLEQLERERVVVRIRERLGDALLRRVEPVAARLLGGFGISGAELVPPARLELLLDAVVFLGLRRQCPRLLGRHLGEIDDRLDHRLEALMAEHHGAQHDLLRELLGLGFDHQHSLAGSGDDKVDRPCRQILDLRVDYVLAVDIADACTGDRAEERDAGERHRGRGADQRDEIGIVLQIVAQHRADDLRLVEKAGCEERTDRPVDQTRDQRLFFRRPSLAFEEAARDLASGEGLLLVVDSEWEEILSRLRRAARHRGAQHRRLAIRRHDGAIGLPGNLAGLQNQARAAPPPFLAEYLEHFLSSFLR